MNLGFDEWADDVLFAGSHTISSFRFKYTASEAVQAVFRFYGVDQATGKTGSLLMEIVRGLPAGAHTLQIPLSAVEQFILSAEGGLNKSAVTGGWFSIQIVPLDGNTRRVALVVLGQARGVSARGLYNVTTGKSVSTFDPDGFIPGSF